MKKTRNLWLATALLAALSVSGCGGGDDDVFVAAPAAAVPDSASASAAAFASFLASLDPSDETSEPLTISDAFVTPLDDLGDPQPVT